METTLSNLDWYNTTYKNLGRAAEATADWAAQIAALEAPFAEAIAKADELGLATGDLATRQAEAVQRLYDARQTTLNDLSFGLDVRGAQASGDAGRIEAFAGQQFERQATSQMSALQLQLQQLGLSAEEQTPYVALLGRTIDAERAARERATAATRASTAAQQEAAYWADKKAQFEQQQAMRTQAAQSVAGVFSDITAYVRTLQTGSDSSLTAADREALARQQLQAVGGAAAAGDYTSASQFTSYADAYRQAATAAGAGPGRAAADQAILAMAERIGAVNLDTLNASAMQSIAREQTETFVAAQERSISVQQTMVSEIRYLRLAMDGLMRRAA